MIAALGASVVQRLIDLLNAQGLTGPVVPPLVNHTQPTYVADTDYTENIDGVLVTYLTTLAFQNILGGNTVPCSQIYQCFTWRRDHSFKRFGAI